MVEREHAVRMGLLAAGAEEVIVRVFQDAEVLLYHTSLFSHLRPKQEELVAMETRIFSAVWDYHTTHPSGIAAKMEPIMDFIYKNRSLPNNENMKNVIQNFPIYMANVEPDSMSKLCNLMSQRIMERTNTFSVMGEHERPQSTGINEQTGEASFTYAEDEEGYLYCTCPYCKPLSMYDGMEEMVELMRFQSFIYNVNLRQYVELDTEETTSAPV